MGLAGRGGRAGRHRAAARRAVRGHELVGAGDELGRAYRLGERGAALVRPDGKLAWTSRDHADADAWPQLAAAVAGTLGEPLAVGEPVGVVAATG